MAFLFTIDIGKSWKKIEQRGSQAGNGRKMAKMGCRVKMAGNGFPRVIRRGSQVDNGRKRQKWVTTGKWQEMDCRVFCS